MNNRAVDYTIKTPVPYPVGASWLKKGWWHVKVHFVLQFRKAYVGNILSMLEHNPDAQLLDLGYGNGEITMKVARKIGTKGVFGIDIRKLDTEEGLTGYLGDLNNPFPVPDKEYDVVCASQIIEHLNDTDTFVKEAYRVLKSNGYLVISTENLSSWHNVAYLILGKQPEPCAVSDELGLTGRRPAHRRLFTIPALIKLLRYYGFKIEKVKGSGYPPLPLCLAKFMCFIDKGHSKGMIIKARK